MEDVLSLIRSLAEQLQDPPEIPYEGEVRDQEYVERASQDRHVSEQFVSDADPTKEPTKPAMPADATIRSSLPPVLPEVITGERYDIAPSEVIQPTREDPRGTQVYEPIQVAAAMATAQLNSPEGSRQVEVVDNTRLVSQQVTATTRVTHVIPEGFPIDAGHAFAAVDRDVTLPEVETDPTKIGPFRPSAVPPSTEKLVFEGYTMNSTEQDRHARLVF